ncbi:hypothetical protein [Microcystis phage Mel-JY01]
MNTTPRNEFSTMKNCKYFHWNPEAENTAVDREYNPSILVRHSDITSSYQYLLINLSQSVARRLKKIIIEQLEEGWVEYNFPPQEINRVVIKYIYVDDAVMYICGGIEVEDETSSNGNRSRTNHGFQISATCNVINCEEEDHNIQIHFI